MAAIPEQQRETTPGGDTLRELVDLRREISRQSVRRANWFLLAS